LKKLAESTKKKPGRKPKNLMKQELPEPEIPKVEKPDEPVLGKRKRKPTFDDNEYVLDMHSRKRRRKQEPVETRGQCYKTFYGRNLQIFIIS
jgi:hypothetical protein